MFIEQSARAQTVNCRNIWARFAAITRPLSRLRSATRNALRLGHQRPPNWKLSPGNCRRCDKLHDIKGSRQAGRKRGMGLRNIFITDKTKLSAFPQKVMGDGGARKLTMASIIQTIGNARKKKKRRREFRVGRIIPSFLIIFLLLLDSSRMQFLK